jgi:hypothetical protein
MNTPTSTPGTVALAFVQAHGSRGNSVTDQNNINADALADLRALMARCEQAEAERDDARQSLQDAETEAKARDAEAAELAAALQRVAFAAGSAACAKAIYDALEAQALARGVGK